MKYVYSSLNQPRTVGTMSKTARIDAGTNGLEPIFQPFKNNVFFGVKQIQCVFVVHVFVGFTSYYI